MNVREESAARALVQGFLKDSIPEYIKDTGQEILSSGGVHKLSIRKDGESWDVEGIVQGEDFQNYSPHLLINPGDSQITHTCNCHEAFMGVCRHVAAMAPVGTISFFVSFPNPGGSSSRCTEPGRTRPVFLRCTRKRRLNKFCAIPNGATSLLSFCR